MRYLFLLFFASLFSCKSNSAKVADSSESTKTKTVAVNVSNTETETTSRSDEPSQNGIEKITKTDAEWKAQLTKQEYYVLREEGTERPHTSPLNNEKRKGTFVCKACDLALFASDTKFKSGTGWPSFYQPLAEANIHENTDYKIGYARTEVECARCGGHLGHVFNDGPKPTGLRYCINGVSLDFKPE